MCGKLMSWDACRTESVDYVRESRVLLDFIRRLSSGQPICQASADPSSTAGRFTICPSGLWIELRACEYQWLTPGLKSHLDNLSSI